MIDAHRREVLELSLQSLAEDAFIPLLAPFIGLRVLDLNAPGITDAGLSRFPELPALAELSLTRAGLSDTSLPRIARCCPNLQQLNLSLTSISDAGLAALAPLTGLTSLSLIATRITDAGLVHLRALHQLESLSLPGSGWLGSSATPAAGASTGVADDPSHPDFPKQSLPGDPVCPVAPPGNRP